MSGIARTHVRYRRRAGSQDCLLLLELDLEYLRCDVGFLIHGYGHSFPALLRMAQVIRFYEVVELSGPEIAFLHVGALQACAEL